MDFRVDIVITSLFLGTVQPDPGSHVCTRFFDLSEPCGCRISQETLDPTCGSDGHTYLSTCFLECQKIIGKVDISIDYKGVCTKESQCVCHAKYEPVCGSNGVTYSNDCLFNCFMKKDDRIRLKHSGECSGVDGKSSAGKKCCRPKSKSQPKSRRCYTQFDDNGQRHARSSRDCSPKKENLLSVQTLQAEQTVQPANKPVNSPSSHNQIKYENSRPNEDMLEKLNEANSKLCACAAIHKPVCGTNCKTFANFCVLHCTSKKNPSLKLRHWGACVNMTGQ